MQSIYRFREAEVGLFLRTRREGLGTVALEPLELTSNFRSQAGVVDWVNRAFAGVFPAREDPSRGAVRYSPAAAVKPASADPAVQLHLLEERDDDAEARQVAELARTALSASADATAAILVRSRSHLSAILPALRSAGLRYQSQDIDPLSRRPVARDLVALTKALLHPADDLSWLAVLRAPWSGLTLADLHALCAGRGIRTSPECLSDPALLERLSPDGRERAGRTGAVLADAAFRRGRVGLRRLVEGCWLALGGPAVLDATGEEDAGMVFTLLESLEAGGDLPVLDAFDDALAALFAAPDAGADGRLQIMTIHKAKGLEFNTVILPGLGRRSRSAEAPLLRWLEHDECGLLLAPIAPRDGGSRDPIYDAIGRLEKEQGDFELGRLLYVAATRARRQLHLLGHAGRDREGLVIMVTLGTGIGTALFINGHLVPNTELGHLTLQGRDAETWAAESVREKKNLSWKKWARRVDAYLRLLDGFFWPDLFIIGGGVSRKWQKFLPRLTLAAPVVPAKLRNEAGIIGAALAYHHERRRARQRRSLG